MIELIKQEYWSKSDAFLLPLTGLARTQEYKLESYLFWEKYSIENYFLIIRFTYDDYDKFVKYCRRVIFPALDKNNYLIETYDYKNQCVMVLDMSEWGFDIETFLVGKYSKMSNEAIEKIEDYHTFYDRGYKIDFDIRAILEPNVISDILGNKTPIEYVAENYGFPLEDLQKIGEIGGIYNKEKETLVTKGEHDYYLQKEGSTLS